MENLSATSVDALKRAVEGRNSAQGFVMMKQTEFKEIHELGLIEFNKAKGEGKGANLAYPVRATDEGMKVASAADPTKGVLQSTSTPQFEVEKGMPLPALRRRGSGSETASKYPFATLEIGDNFHVSTNVMADPSKTMAPAIMAANRKFAEKIEGQHKTKPRKREDGTTPEPKMVDNYRLTRKFVMRKVDDTDPKGTGVRIFRVELPKNVEVKADNDADHGDEA